jgi:hypothetical protein
MGMIGIWSLILVLVCLCVLCNVNKYFIECFISCSIKLYLQIVNVYLTIVKGVVKWLQLLFTDSRQHSALHLYFDMKLKNKFRKNEYQELTVFLCNVNELLRYCSYNI